MCREGVGLDIARLVAILRWMSGVVKDSHLLLLGSNLIAIMQVDAVSATHFKSLTQSSLCHLKWQRVDGTDAFYQTEVLGVLFAEGNAVQIGERNRGSRRLLQGHVLGAGDLAARITKGREPDVPITTPVKDASCLCEDDAVQYQAHAATLGVQSQESRCFVFAHLSFPCDTVVSCRGSLDLGKLARQPISD